MNHFKISLLLLFIITAGGFLVSCHDSPIGPSEDIPGRRDYTWSVDTIKVYTRVNDMWGSAPDDIWSIGRGDFNKSVFHYDGHKWTIDNTYKPFAPCSIWGLDKNNVYIGAMMGSIWKYAANKWSEAAVLEKDGTNQIVVEGLWGESENDVYAYGAYWNKTGDYNNGILAHYTGEWKVINTDGVLGIIERFYKNDYDGKYYIRTNFFGLTHPDSTFLYEYGYKGIKKVYSSVYSQGKKQIYS